MAAEPSVSLTQSFKLRLEGLGDCPLRLDQSWTLQDYQIGIVWLEEEKIRLLAVKNRDWLPKTDDAVQWTKDLSSYCQKLEITTRFKGSTITLDEIQLVFGRLLARALEEVYVDERKAMASPKTTAEVAGTSEGEETRTAPDVVRKFVYEVLGSEAFPPPTVAEAVDVMESRLVPNSNTGGDVARYNEEKVIRLVATQRLTGLQYQVDKLVSNLQLVTASPKTDHKLGRVGV